MKVDNLIYDADKKKLVEQDRSFNIQEFKNLCNRLWNNFLRPGVLDDFVDFVHKDAINEESKTYRQLLNLPLVEAHDLLP